MRHVGKSSAGVALMVLAACGGGDGAGDDSTTPTGPVTAGGEAVTPEAEERWEDALARFNASEEAGWNSNTCSSTLEAFEAAVEAQGGGFAEAHYMAGLTELRCQQKGRAESRFEEALSADDNHCKARVSIGLLRFDSGDVDDAESAFRRALEGDPRCAEAYVNLAVIQRNQGGDGIGEALNNLRRALAIESESMPAFNEMALLYLQRAKLENKERWLDLAAVVCRQAQLVDADYAPIYNTWGLISVRKENIIEAIRFFERAVRLDPEMFEGHMNFAASTLSFRGYEDAQRSYQRAAELRPESYEAHIGLGAALRGLNQVDQAEQQYRRAIAIDARRPEAYFNLGVLYQDYRSGSVSDLEQAKGFYEEFLSRTSADGPFEAAVAGVRRQCNNSRPRRRRGSSACRPGRLQNIGTAVEAMRAAAAMQQGS